MTDWTEYLFKAIYFGNVLKEAWIFFFLLLEFNLMKSIFSLQLQQEYLVVSQFDEVNKILHAWVDIYGCNSL